MTTDSLILKTSHNGVIRLTLNRPQARNGLSTELLRALQAELDALALDPAARVIILAGAGPAFCSGHDLKEVRANQDNRDYLKQLFDTCSTLMQSIVHHPRPIIAEVHGIATAAGCQLVASCDLAIAADDARFATPGVNIGLFCSTPMVALSRNVSHKHAMELLLTGDMLSAADAERFGLINRAVPPTELTATVDALASRIASKSIHTLKVGKKAFYHQAELPLDQAYAYASEVMVDNLQAHDAQEGIAAFLQKRTPVWCDH